MSGDDEVRGKSGARRDAEAVLREAGALGEGAERHNPFWPAQLTVLVAVLLDLGLTDRLTIGSRWLLPIFEGLLLLGLVVATPRARSRPALRRQIAIGLIGLVSAVNLYSLVELARLLVDGTKAGGHALIGSGALLWGTNVLLFGLWYWELDRGGPVRRMTVPDALPDFLFPQMTEPKLAPQGWIPGLLDYLYVSFTNATAFSPTDTMPLTVTAKVLMSVQSFASLVTVGLVIARAVNILQA